MKVIVVPALVPPPPPPTVRLDLTPGEATTIRLALFYLMRQKQRGAVGHIVHSQGGNAETLWNVLSKVDIG